MGRHVRRHVLACALLVAWVQLGVVAAEMPADAMPTHISRVATSKVSLASVREPKRALARAAVLAASDVDVEAEAAHVAAAAGSAGLVGLVRGLLDFLLRLCLKLLGMDSLLQPAGEALAAAAPATATKRGAVRARAEEEEEEAEAGEEEEEEGKEEDADAGTAATTAAAAGKGLSALSAKPSAAPPAAGRLGALLGAARAPAAAQADAAAGEAAPVSAVAQQLQHLGFSDKFAEAMSQRMAASAAAGKRPADLNSPWARQLLAQLAQLRGKDKDPLVRVQPPAHLSEWVVELTGAPGSLYEGEKHRLQFEFDRSYPKTPPRVKFLRPVPKHEHVYSDGKICLNILYSDWKPEMTVLGVSQSLISMMASASEKKRPPDNAATIMNSIHQDPSKMQWIFHDEKC